MITSSIGRKGLMAVTGLALFGFVVAHMLGNLQIYLGRDAINAYAVKLEELGPLLWVARIGLLAALLAHIGAATSLTLENMRARPVKYACEKTIQASYASRTMYRSGLIILAFVIYHLLHFTFRVTGPQAGMVELHGHGMVRDVYGMVVLGFKVWYIALAYVIAQLVLGVHLSHGVSAVFQSLGWRGPKYDHLIGLLGPISAAAIVVGNCSIPLSILAGLVPYGR